MSNLTEDLRSLFQIDSEQRERNNRSLQKYFRVRMRQSRNEMQLLRIARNEKAVKNHTSYDMLENVFFLTFVITAVIFFITIGLEFFSPGTSILFGALASATGLSVSALGRFFTSAEVTPLQAKILQKLEKHYVDGVLTRDQMDNIWKLLLKVTDEKRSLANSPTLTEYLQNALERAEKRSSQLDRLFITQAVEEVERKSD